MRQVTLPMTRALAAVSGAYRTPESALHSDFVKPLQPGTRLDGDTPDSNAGLVTLGNDRAVAPIGRSIERTRHRERATSHGEHRSRVFGRLILIS